MSRAQIEMDEQTFARAEALARQKGVVTLEQLLAELIDQAAAPVSVDQVLGLFSDEPDLMDQVAEDALHSREESLLRLLP